MAEDLGLEPRLPDPESGVLPLHQSSAFISFSIIIEGRIYVKSFLRRVLSNRNIFLVGWSNNLLPNQGGQEGVSGIGRSAKMYKREKASPATVWEGKAPVLGAWRRLTRRPALNGWVGLERRR